MNGTICRAAVIGHPIEHSLSPLIHRHWIDQYRLSADYSAVDVAPEDLAERVQLMAKQGYAGFNVTIPHKVTVMDLCRTLDPVAEKIGAVNTVVLKSGGLHGMNTDAFGFLANLKTQAPQWKPGAGPALVLGAGGAARAILYALRDAGVPALMLANRTPERAAALANTPDIRRVSWEDRSAAAREAALIVNATSLGMDGQAPLDIDLRGSAAIVYDIVYRPLLTPLLRQAGGLGLPIVTGLGMLLQQARPAFQAWFDVWPEVGHDLEDKINRAANRT